MADIIRIEERFQRSTRRMTADAAAGTDAVILLFTGIRYERLDTVESVGRVGPVKGALHKTKFQKSKKH